MVFSLILATYGRSVEVGRFLESLVDQTLGADCFEVILIDQNDEIDLSGIVSKYSVYLNIVYIKSDRKGLSYNRNIGLSHAQGEFICFPDDDCTYYPDTLSVVLSKFSEGGVSSVFGAIRDRDVGENIIRDWPCGDKKITRYNFFNLYSSITIFTKNNGLRFNEELGVGCYYGSCEDTDYVYSLVREIGGCCYFGDVEVWHPKTEIKQISKEKVVSYGLGFGAFCSLRRFDLFILRLYFMALGFHGFMALYSAVKGDFESAGRRVDALTSRVRGFFEYTLK